MFKVFYNWLFHQIIDLNYNIKVKNDWFKVIDDKYNSLHLIH